MLFYEISPNCHTQRFRVSNCRRVAPSIYQNQKRNRKSLTDACVLNTFYPEHIIFINSYECPHYELSLMNNEVGHLTSATSPSHPHPKINIYTYTHYTSTANNKAAVNNALYLVYLFRLFFLDISY